MGGFNKLSLKQEKEDSLSEEILSLDQIKERISELNEEIENLQDKGVDANSFITEKDRLQSLLGQTEEVLKSDQTISGESPRTGEVRTIQGKTRADYRAEIAKLLE